MKTRNFTKSISLLLLLVFAGGLKAQEYSYTPFPTENAQWSVNNEKYALYGDTIINEKKYSKVYKQTADEAFEFDIDKAEYFCAIRNDVENKRVYGVYKKDLPIKYHDNIYYTNRTSKKEFLLYDFSLNLGDTVSVANFDEAENDGFIRYVKFKRVETIGIDITNNTFVTLHDNDSIFVLANGEQRKRILMENISETLFQSWIEGIGSSDGPFNHYNNFSFELFTIKRLLCFNENEECLYKQSSFDYDEDDDCFTNYYPDNVVENNENDIMIYPNPTDDFINIENPSGSEYSIDIYNDKGQKLISQSSSGISNINISDLPCGLYIITINSNYKNYNFKLIKTL
jgi:hypothetical protein